MLEFRRFSKQNYWKNNKKAGAKDDIMFGDYCEDGGGDWEFSIEEEDFGNEETALKIKMYNDTVKCLKNPQVIKSLIEMERKTTLDQAEVVLKDNGIREVIK